MCTQAYIRRAGQAHAATTCACTLQVPASYCKQNEREGRGRGFSFQKRAFVRLDVWTNRMDGLCREPIFIWTNFIRKRDTHAAAPCPHRLRTRHARTLHHVHPVGIEGCPQVSSGPGPRLRAPLLRSCAAQHAFEPHRTFASSGVSCLRRCVRVRRRRGCHSVGQRH